MKMCWRRVCNVPKETNLSGVGTVFVLRIGAPHGYEDRLWSGGVMFVAKV
jgi:hypothetical protein